MRIDVSSTIVGGGILSRKLISLGLILAKALTVLVLATFAITVIARLLPGDPARNLLPYGTPAQQEALRQELGLNSNIFAYYFKWLGNFVTGDFGVAYDTTGTATTINSLISEALPRSLLLMLYTMIFSLMVSIPLGVLLGYRADSRLDKVGSNILFFLSSIPNFIIAIILIYFLSIENSILPALGYVPLGDGIWAHLESLILPVVALSIGLIATQTRLLRADMIATLREDFVTMASSKGLSNSFILWRHAFRPSSLTLMTSAALNMGSLIGGAIVIESLFALNGYGTLLAIQLNTRQYLGIQSVVALITVAYVVFNAIVDALNVIVDPRIRRTDA